MGQLKKITYSVNGKKKTLTVKPVSIYSSGLLFKRTSPPLLFTLKKPKEFIIFSYFCKPFTAIWLDENMSATKIEEITNWRWVIRGYAKYLIEIPHTVQKRANYRRDIDGKNRKV